ncbi:glycerophosphodiester phosphodiesterase [Rickettsia asembonensis]|uniref:GP-PDE domain-containing protein n=1 Tax=Rickettsia asembonensis TaxID=1068590 RepID=A0A0C2RDH7_9RICK|nr:glycerophosphodiester phosphodiesterase family protein [Rickettsia asembonensis]KIJ88860.1 hypothetical protein SB78_03130 [Rickettsia asembonensis]WCR57362.1 MAG: hypothetical protein PG979_001419 [Rickettsia asembonensis]
MQLIKKHNLYTPTALVTSPTLTYFPKYIAHESLTSEKFQGNKFQGNSVEAVQNALMSYVDGIEVDVRLSKDGIPFLYQAKTLEEATNGYGKPEDYKWEQLKQLSYKSNNQKLLALTDLFNLVGSQKFIFLDIKSDKIFDHEFCSKITELINKYHIEERVIVESFNPFFLALMRLNSRNI